MKAKWMQKIQKPKSKFMEKRFPGSNIPIKYIKGISKNFKLHV